MFGRFDPAKSAQANLKELAAMQAVPKVPRILSGVKKERDYTVPLFLCPQVQPAEFAYANSQGTDCHAGSSQVPNPFIRESIRSRVPFALRMNPPSLAKRVLKGTQCHRTRRFAKRDSRRTRSNAKHSRSHSPGSESFCPVSSLLPRRRGPAESRKADSNERVRMRSIRVSKDSTNPIICVTRCFMPKL